MFRTIVGCALIAGVLGGLFLTVVQQLQVTPLIIKAEKVEEASAVTGEEHHYAPAAHQHSHEPGDSVWQPENGLERTAYTVLANTLAGIGFALLLAAAMAIHGKSGWKKGLLWGLAGYAVFFVAPSLGLTPKAPGSAAAALFDRQVWWIATAISTAIGLGLLSFGRSILLKGVGLIFLAAPHLFGAPQLEMQASAQSEDLAQAFIQATVAANGLFWLALGVLTGMLLKRFGVQLQ